MAQIPIGWLVDNTGARSRRAATGLCGDVLAAYDLMDTPGEAGDDVQYVYAYEGNGNVVQVLGWAATSASTVRKVRYEYDPYGNWIFIGDFGAYNRQPFRFSTKLWDQDTGLGYWGYRWYWPTVGRWISRDPIEETNAPNLYDALADDPIGNIDGAGLSTDAEDRQRLIEEWSRAYPDFDASAPLGSRDNPYNSYVNACELTSAKLLKEAYADLAEHNEKYCSDPDERPSCCPYTLKIFDLSCHKDPFSHLRTILADATRAAYLDQPGATGFSGNATVRKIWELHFQQVYYKGMTGTLVAAFVPDCEGCCVFGRESYDRDKHVFYRTGKVKYFSRRIGFGTYLTTPTQPWVPQS